MEERFWLCCFGCEGSKAMLVFVVVLYRQQQLMNAQDDGSGRMCSRISYMN